MSGPELFSLTVPQLQERLVTSGLSKTGRKADLVTRLLQAQGPAESASTMEDNTAAASKNQLVKISFKSLEELEKTVIILEVEEGTRYSLTMEVPLTQAALTMLAGSPLGRELEVLDCRPEYEDRNPPVIDTSKVKFLKLRRLDLTHQAIKAVHLTADCFPLLEALSIDQPCARDPETFNTDLPNLCSMSFNFVTILDVKNFGRSLSRSPKLERFSGYKLWGLGRKAEHSLVLPSCISLDFYRSDDLRKLKLWAPRLEDLDLQACYSIKTVTLLDRRPNGFSGPEYQFTGEPSKFVVNCANTNEPGGNLVTSSRCKKVQRGVDFFRNTLSTNLREDMK
eukprot:GFUD01089606.1.p1 GENE.GFUD01089606.1~~GFUD01089606.1.p1  ORF type:complete len:338 (-),score=103.75 GFUD01089606.1:77-1090(-)